jgi:hypothetical protein
MRRYCITLAGIVSLAFYKIISITKKKEKAYAFKKADQIKIKIIRFKAVLGLKSYL